MAKEPTTQIAFRLPDSLIARLDRHVERMTKGTPGARLTRADAVRSLVTRALDQIEGPKRAREARRKVSEATDTSGAPIRRAIKTAS